MPVPKYHELFDPVLIAMRALGGSASISELDDEVTKLLPLTPEEASEPHGDRGTELEYRLAWARSYLKAYGLLENSKRGVWVLTPAGRETTHVDSNAVRRHVRQQWRARKRAEDPAPRSEDPEDGEPVEPVLEMGWRDRLRQTLVDLPPAAFERLCQRLLRESGFVQVQVTGKAGDGGIDGVGVVRLGGLLGFPVLFQCKRYSGTVGPSAIRDFRGAMIGRSDRGLVLTTGTFTPDAKREARRDGAPPIDLVDGEELLDKLKDLGLGVRVEMIEEVSVDGDFFSSI